MITTRLSRRDLLGTTAGGLAAIAALPAMATFHAGGANASAAHRCIVTHQQLAQELRTLFDDPDVSSAEAAYAQKTCRCSYCNVSITAMNSD